MSFYVKSTPEVANFYGFTEFNPNDIFLVCSGNMVGVTNEYNLKHHYRDLPEYKLHPKHGMIPANSKLFLDSTETNNIEYQSTKTKQPNEKPDQREENENMNRKSDFPVVGEKVLIKSKHGIVQLEDSTANACLNKECIVLSKFKYFDRDVVSVCLDEFSGVACFSVDCCFPVKTEREKEIENFLDLICEGGTVNDIAERLYNEGYRKLKD